MIQLGSLVKDRLTGLKGVVMVRAEYLTGCVHVGICSQSLTKEGKEPEWVWIDERRCEVVKADAQIMGASQSKIAANPVSGPFQCGPKS